MSRFEPNFLEDEKKEEPFEGCLLVLNIGNENCENIGMTKDFRVLLTEAVAKAHASGWLVCYVFDSKRGSSPPPDFLDSAPEQDRTYLSHKVFGMDVVNLSLLPGIRAKQLRQLVEHIFLQQNVGPAKVMGLCHIDGDEVFLPPTIV